MAAGASSGSIVERGLCAFAGHWRPRSRSDLVDGAVRRSVRRVKLGSARPSRRAWVRAGGGLSWSLDPLTTLSLYIGAFAGTVILSELLRRTRLEADGAKEVSRVVLGLALATAPVVSAETWPVLAVAALISLVMALTWSRQGLPGMHGVKGASTGTALTPLAFLLLVIAWQEEAPWIAAVATTVVTLADPAGAWVGRRVAAPPVTLWHDPKTVPGSVAVGVVAALATAAAMTLWAPAALASGPALALAVVSVAVIATLAEGLSRQGSDNLSLPLAVALTLTLVAVRARAGTLGGLGFVLFASAGVSWLAWRLRWLTMGGACAATLVGFFLFGVAGWSGALPLLVFLVGGGLLSSLATRWRGLPRDARGPRRELAQVVSKFGVAAVLTVAGLLGAHDAWYTGVIGALAVGASDTWASEVGRLSGEWPRRITTWMRVTLGTSGGVTVYGFTGALLGAGAVVASAWPWLGDRQVAAMLVVVAVACSLLDSVLGDTLQARYRGPDGQVSERYLGKRDAVSGVPWMDNEAVNLIVSSLGGLLGVWVGIRWG